MLYTSTIRYKGPGKILDITVKNKHPFGYAFAPTWSMVMDYKKYKDEESYITLYNAILRLSNTKSKLEQLSKMCHEQDVVLVCFCRAENFCHRFLLAQHLVKNYQVAYVGEV